MFTKDYNDIITIENLLATWARFLPGKRNRLDVLEFQLHLAENLASLQKDLANFTYEHGPYEAFKISDPKPREIHKATVRDRVVHHLIYMVLYPYFEDRFIYDSFSCQKEKGVHLALDRFKKFSRQVSRNNSRTCYVLKCDVKKFFANVDNRVLVKILKRYIADPDFLKLIEKVIASFHAVRPGVGLPLGNLTSQLLVNIYMHEFDMYVKQGLRVKYYVRYADDFVVLAEGRKYLQDLLPKFGEFLQNELKLKLHEQKVYIKTSASGLDFLGWVHFPHHRQIRTTTKRKVIRNLSGYPKPETVNSYRGLLRHGDTYLLQKRLELVD